MCFAVADYMVMIRVCGTKPAGRFQTKTLVF